MRIAVLVPTLVRRGGVPRVAIEETKGLRKLGYSVTCYSFVGKKGLWKIFADVPVRFYPNVPFPFLRQSLNCWLSCHIPPKIAADIVVCHAAAALPAGCYLKKKHGARCIAFMHDLLRYAHPFLLFVLS